MAGDDSSHRRYQVSGRVALSVLRSDGDVGKTCFFSARLLTPCSPALGGFGCNLACNHGASATGLGDGSHSEKVGFAANFGAHFNCALWPQHQQTQGL